METEEETVQTKPLADRITPLIQRQPEEEEEKEEREIGFEDCDRKGGSEEKDALEKAHKKAIELIEMAIDQLSNNPEAVYQFRAAFTREELFGPHDLREEKEKIDFVLKIYGKALEGLKSENFNYECDYEEDWFNLRCRKEGDLAWTMPGSSYYDIHICWDFFRETPYDQASAIIHEAVHKWGGIRDKPDPLNNAYKYEDFIKRLVQSGTSDSQSQNSGKTTIQPKGISGGTAEITSSVESDINALKGGGQRLPRSVRNFFEPRFGHDFSGVRVHTDTRATEAARSANARAFTFGKDVVFGVGQYAPGSAAGNKLLAHELTHVIQQRRYQRPVLQRWNLKSREDCLVRGVDLAKSLLEGKKEKSEAAYGRWGCALRDFIEAGKGPEIEIKYGGIACAISWKSATGEDLISINPGLIDCCSDCPVENKNDVVRMIAYTIIHETAHWCAASHGKPTDIEHGDELTKTLFGGVHILENCVIKNVATYGDKPCFTCPYVVKEGDSLWKIAEKLYADGKKWRRIYNANRAVVGDDPNFIRLGMRLFIPPLKVVR